MGQTQALIYVWLNNTVLLNKKEYFPLIQNIPFKKWGNKILLEDDSIIQK
jgi:hypothetical protein